MSALSNPGSTPRPISRVTVGSLDDMGYEVDYDQADPFSASDLNPSCRCHNDDDQRMLQSSSSSSLERSNQKSLRRLSADGKKEAIRFGLEQLEQMNRDIIARDESALIANQLVVSYVEDGIVYDVVVRHDAADGFA